MSRISRTLAFVSATSLLSLSALAVAAPADARPRVERASGSCSNGATWKLKAKADDGRIEVEFEVDTNRNGQRWDVKISDNGTRVYHRTRTTVAPSGSFTVHKRITNRAGADAITAKATRTSTGATCVGHVTY